MSANKLDDKPKTAPVADQPPAPDKAMDEVVPTPGS